MIAHCSSFRARDLSFFVIPLHEADGDGVLENPGSWPYRKKDSDPPCRVVLDHLRDRSTGPCVPLRVCRCPAHARAYTLYPPSFGP